MPDVEDNRIDKLGLSARSIEGYKLLDKNHNIDGNPMPIGMGGSGIVYKARQFLHEDAYVDRAIKFFMYEESILTDNPQKEPVSNDDFISEIGNITTFNHQSLIRVVSAGIYKCSEGNIPYIVTDYIDGTTLTNVIGLDPQCID